MKLKAAPPFRANVKDICVIYAIVKRYCYCCRVGMDVNGGNGAEVKRKGRDGARGMGDGELGVWE